jgi:hypothetical protein
MTKEFSGDNRLNGIWWFADENNSLPSTIPDVFKRGDTIVSTCICVDHVRGPDIAEDRFRAFIVQDVAVIGPGERRRADQWVRSNKLTATGLNRFLLPKIQGV